ncbi:MAG: ERF family protein [Candidatus Riflebacteria bacterium]|nr:ERF family protein [Candidatus Riflebacteria bacterium]
METSKEIGKISEALAKAQGMIKPASFDASNPHYRSKYASLASIMEAGRAALSANNVAIVQGTSVEENRVVVTTMLIHSSGEWIRDSLAIKLIREDAQTVGSTITYARRYSLASMAGIVSDSDDDDGEKAVGRSDGKPVLTSVKKTPAPVNLASPAATKTVAQAKQSAAKSEAASAPANAEPVQPVATQPESTKAPTPAPMPQNGRIAKIRQIFTVSAQLGQSVDQMKIMVGDLLELGSPIRESSQIPSDKLDMIIDAFQKALTDKNNSQKEAA